MEHCEKTNGMNAPLSIAPTQTESSPKPEQQTPSGDINPTYTEPGLTFSSPTPQINVTLDQPATLTVIYVPTDRPDKPTTVEEFTVTFVYPNGTRSTTYSSVTPPTPLSSTPSETTTPSPSSTGVVPPSSGSPQVQLPPNFEVPTGTIVVIDVKQTKDNSSATGVCIMVESERDI